LPSYINFEACAAWGGRERRTFLGHYWRLAGQDRRWTPPYFPALARALNPATDAHLSRLDVYTVALDATRLRGRLTGPGALDRPAAVPLEMPVAAAAVIGDPVRRPGVACVALCQCLNHPDVWRRLLDHLGEALPARGYRRLVGPTGLAPCLGGGLLVEGWNLSPPRHSDYWQPFMAELIATTAQPGERRLLYQLQVPGSPDHGLEGIASLAPLHEPDLEGRLLPLLAVACQGAGCPEPPDAPEAAFLRRWLAPGTLSGWVAYVEGAAVGFVLAQPDLARHLRRIGGGRGWLQRLFAPAVFRWPARAGRILLGAVMPAWRGKGIGRQLIFRALADARRQGWESMAIGPVLDGSPAAHLLVQLGATTRHSYQLFEWTF
jgi:GNAT superfamily N-acetyltransferase